MLVAGVQAVDADDALEGTNAQLSYLLEKNVVNEASGEPLFRIDALSGAITTAVCCLDREKTPHYLLQVVATDGGGLKGTGWVSVLVQDLNDNPPRFAQREWFLDVPETPGAAPPDNATLLEVMPLDPDTSNLMYYRIVQDSGPGWDLFSVREVLGHAQVFAKKNLDYENELHRKGFRFRLQVTDLGKDGWHDPVHFDSTWINITLVDVNDNHPLFSVTQVQISLSEDKKPGAYITSVHATDMDSDENGRIFYNKVHPEKFLCNENSTFYPWTVYA